MAAAPSAAASERSKPVTAPPPERSKPIASARTKPVTAPPPARTKPLTAPPPIRSSQRAIKSGPTDTGTFDASGVIGGDQTPAPALAGGERSSRPDDTAGELSSIVSSLPLRADPTDVSAPPSAVPPPVPPRSARPTAPPPVASSASITPTRATGPTPVAASAPRPDTDDVLTIPEYGGPAAMPALAVPLGEFDTGNTFQDSERMRLAHSQPTVKRETPANGAVRPPPPPTTPPPAPAARASGLAAFDPSTLANAGETEKFERGDPTQLPDPTAIAVPSLARGGQGKLRTGAAFRRKRGLLGDVRYVATAVLGVRRARRELGELETKQTQREASRRRHLITLGRTAVTASGFDHPSLAAAREQLIAVEEERSKHTGQVTAADSELMRVRRDREDKAKAHAEEIARLDSELAAIGKKLEPLEKEVGSVTKRAEELRDSLQRIDHRITQTEANIILSRTNPKLDRAALQAELVSLRADKLSVQRDEPQLASELDAIQPRIAALEAARNEARKKRAEIIEAEDRDQKRTEELLAAIGAKRKVVDRAAADAETLRDKVLFELGELLYVDRPADMVFELAPIDAIDVDLGTGERRMMELREIMSSVDKMKLARGIALLILLLGALATAGYGAYVLFG